MATVNPVYATAKPAGVSIQLTNEEAMGVLICLAGSSGDVSEKIMNLYSKLKTVYPEVAEAYCWSASGHIENIKDWTVWNKYA